MFIDVQGMFKIGFLIIVLGVMCMYDYCVREDMIWRVLNMMGVIFMENYYVVGNVKKFFLLKFLYGKGI